MLHAGSGIGSNRTWPTIACCRPVAALAATTKVAQHHAISRPFWHLLATLVSPISMAREVASLKRCWELIAPNSSSSSNSSSSCSNSRQHAETERCRCPRLSGGAEEVTAAERRKGAPREAAACDPEVVWQNRKVLTTKQLQILQNEIAERRAADQQW